MKRLIYILILFICQPLLYGQDVNFTINAPKYVKVGEQFEVQFSINKRLEDFKPPSFNDFQLLGGPMQSSSTSISTINGKTQRSITYTLIYYYKATKPGVFEIAPAEATVRNKVYKTKPHKIEVVGSSSANQGKSGAGSTPTVQGQSGEDLFVSVVFDKRKAYVGEQITAWVKIYTKVDISKIDYQSFKGPDFNGFFKQDIEIGQLQNLEREKVGDELYYSGVIRKYIITPQKSGKITINPFNLTVYQRKQVKQSSRSLFDEFLGGGYTQVPVQLTSKTKTLEIVPLPANRPSGFSGAVGNFNIKGTLNANVVKTNDAVTFKVVLSGTGNIKLVENLRYDLSSLEEYDPVINTTINKEGRGGTKVFEYTAIPRYPGTYEISPFKLVFFDPSAGKYKTVQTQAFTLEVQKSGNDTSNVVISNLSKKDVELLNSDIRFIKTETDLQQSSSFIINKIWYLIFYVAAILLFVLIVVLKRKQIKDNSDIARTKNKKANRMARKRLAVAKKYLTENNSEDFFEELSKALWGYLSDKLSINISNLSAESAKSALTTKGVDQVVIDEYFELVSSCEYARYAPGTTSKSTTEIYEQAVKLILKVDQNI